MRSSSFKAVFCVIAMQVRRLDRRVLQVFARLRNTRIAQLAVSLPRRVLGEALAVKLGDIIREAVTPAHIRLKISGITPMMSVVSGLHECPTCGLFQTIPALKPGHVAYCRRCDESLTRRRRTPPLGTPMAFCITSFALYIALLCSNLMMLDAKGRVNTISILTGVDGLAEQGYGAIAGVVALTTVFMPGIVILLMAVTLYGASRKTEALWTAHLLRWYSRLREWAMIEVYILGVFVAYTKLVDLALVELQPGVFLVAAIMITMAATDSTFDTERIWEAQKIAFNDASYRNQDGQLRCIDICKDDVPPQAQMASCLTCGLVVAASQPVGHTQIIGRCPRCLSSISRRKIHSLSNAAALLLAGILAYIPANLFPVMTYVKVGRSDTSTIIHGAIELWQSNLIPLSLLVLFASICVPVLKIIGLGVMVGGSALRMQRGLKRLTKLYRIIDVIGRWSMIDVFMISILVAVVRFGFLANVHAEPGIIFFTFVVIVTIFAVHCFDMRCLWDGAGKNGAELAGRAHPVKAHARYDLNRVLSHLPRPFSSQRGVDPSHSESKQS